MSAEVKKCPKCDGEESKPWNKRTWGKSWWYRECQSCGHHSECEETQFMADYKWNRRATVSMETAQKLADCVTHAITCRRNNDALLTYRDALAAFNREKGGQG